MWTADVRNYNLMRVVIIRNTVPFPWLVLFGYRNSSNIVVNVSPFPTQSHEIWTPFPKIWTPSVRPSHQCHLSLNEI